VDREALIERVRKAAARILSGRGLLAAYAFGSRIAGSARPDSDLDIGYYLAPGARDTALPLGDEMALASALSEEVGLEVDLRDLRSAPLELRGRVLEDGVRVFSGDPAARVALERDILARYHDYKAEFQMMHDLRLRALAERGA
jgi:predicted nucleotidyltransferase